MPNRKVRRAESSHARCMLYSKQLGFSLTGVLLVRSRWACLMVGLAVSEMCRWWPRGDSNPRTVVYETTTAPTGWAINDTPKVAALGVLSVLSLL